jgi:hypothetical protein
VRKGVGRSGNMDDMLLNGPLTHSRGGLFFL